MWRFLTLTLALLARSGMLLAQFQLGAGGGVFYSDLWGRSDVSPNEPTFTHVPNFSPTAAVHYRERAGRTSNFFADLGYMRRSFSTHISSGGLGGGTDEYLNVRLDHIYLTFGPEFGTDAFSARVGLQFGCLANSRMEGRSTSWSMGSGSSSRTIAASEASDFTGDVRFLFGFRSCTGLVSMLGSPSTRSSAYR